MEYDAVILINNELEIIQERALGNNEFYNDSKIRESIEKFDIRYVEDFLNVDVLDDLNELNNFDDETEEFLDVLESNRNDVLFDKNTSYKDIV